MTSDLVQYGFYLGLLIVAGVGEYFKIAPMGTLVAVLALVTGHFFGTATTKSSIAGIASDVNQMNTTMQANNAKLDTVQNTLTNGNGGVHAPSSPSSQVGP